MKSGLKSYSKLQAILELIEREDIKDDLNKNFSRQEQGEIFNIFKCIMEDELNFVLNTIKQEHERRKECFSNVIDLSEAAKRIRGY